MYDPPFEPIEFLVSINNADRTVVAGNKVEGQVIILNATPDQLITKIKVSLDGTSFVQWVNGSLKPTTQPVTVEQLNTDLSSQKNKKHKQFSNIIFSAKRRYGPEEQLIYIEEEDSSRKPSTGSSYSFSIPSNPTWPTSYNGKHGSTSYHITVTIEPQETTSTTAIILIGKSISIPDAASEPHSFARRRHIGFCCCPSGLVDIVLRLPKRPYVFGETIPVQVYVKNKNQWGVRFDVFHVLLKQIVTYISDIPSKEWIYESNELDRCVPRLKVISNSSQQIETTAVQSGEEKTLIAELRLPKFTLPSSSNVSIGEIIRASYTVEVSGKLSGLLGGPVISADNFILVLPDNVDDNHTLNSQQAISSE